MNPKIRVIITGQTGTRKGAFAEKLVAHALAAEGVTRNIEVGNRIINWYQLEDHLPDDYLNFLSKFNEPKHHDFWVDALRRVLAKVEADNPDVALLLMHASYYRDGHFFSPVCWAELLRFRPNCIITLIDDIYDIWHRIESQIPETRLTLDEILHWRSVEILYAKALADNLRIDPSYLPAKRNPPKYASNFFGPPLPYFVMSVKHPVETFRRLIYERTIHPIVYASHPITRTRKDEHHRSEINSFLTQLRQTDAVIIEPLMIDELRMNEQDPMWKTLRNEENYRQFCALRWTVDNPTIPPVADHDGNPFELLSDDQMSKFPDRIYQHLVDRDYRMVSQADVVVAYRPFWGGDDYNDPAGGVYLEIIHAAKELDRAVWAYHPKKDYPPKEDFFAKYAVWSHVRFFPGKKMIFDLPPEDGTGFDILISELKKDVAAFPGKHSTIRRASPFS